jgi:hypothetical protein
MTSSALQPIEPVDPRMAMFLLNCSEGKGSDRKSKNEAGQVILMVGSPHPSPNLETFSSVV